MASKQTPKRKAIPLDGDKLGMIGGTIGAIVVLIVTMASGQSDLISTLLRVGWTFVICYGATFFLVRVVLRTTLQEMMLRKQQERIAKAEKKKKEKAAREAEAANEQASR